MSPVRDAVKLFLPELCYIRMTIGKTTCSYLTTDVTIKMLENGVASNLRCKNFIGLSKPVAYLINNL